MWNVNDAGRRQDTSEAGGRTDAEMNLAARRWIHRAMVSVQFIRSKCVIFCSACVDVNRIDL